MKQLKHIPVLFPALLLSLLLVFVQRASAQARHILILEIEGPVTPAMASYFDRAIQAAEAEQAEAVIIMLDTPGGSVDVTMDIVQSFRNADVPVIVYVAPSGAQAASAGSVIAAAAHAVGMAPETVIGAASPVDSSGADIEETLYRKITEDMKATMRNLTERRGPEAIELAEAMIDEARAVTALEALEVGLIDAVSPDVSHLIADLDGKTVYVLEQEVTLDFTGASQAPFSMSFIEQLLHALSNPVLIGLLLTLGVQGILIEISSPGGWIAGFIGVLSLGMAFYGLGTLPANWLGLVLVIVAFVLFIMEIKTPATGGLAAVGALTLLAGLLVLFNSPGSPEFSRISLSAALSISIATAVFFVFIVTKALQAQRRQPITGIEGMAGKIGEVRAAFQIRESEPERYQGKILVNGEIWRAVGDEPFEAGDRVIVKGADGFTLHVKKTSG